MLLFVVEIKNIVICFDFSIKSVISVIFIYNNSAPPYTFRRKDEINTRNRIISKIS